MYTTTYRLRVNDINYGGHLGQAQLAMILHDARVRYLNDVMGYESEINVEGAGLILIHESTDLQGEAFPGETLSISINAQMQDARFVMNYHVCVSDRNIATSKAILAFFDYTKRKPLKPPHRFCEKLKTLDKN